MALEILGEGVHFSRVVLAEHPGPGVFYLAELAGGGLDEPRLVGVEVLQPLFHRLVHFHVMALNLALEPEGKS